jgi:hypothetical protein
MNSLIYVYVPWPDSQDYMGEDWFHEEAVLDNSEDATSSSYFIPLDRVSSEYKAALVKEMSYPVILDLLIAMDMSLNPEVYESSQGLGPEDFLDLATCKAQELGMDKEFEQEAGKAGRRSG